jgi:hypothetical protein
MAQTAWQKAHKEELNAYRREYRKKHPEKIRATRNAWRAKHRDEQNEIKRRWYANRSEETRKHDLEYQQSRLDKRKASDMIYRKKHPEHIELTKTNRWKTKQRIVNTHGGHCVICGYNKNLAALEFHHVNSEEKVKSRSTSATDADKCVLLCNRCHREHHQGGIEYNYLDKNLEILKRLEAAFLESETQLNRHTKSHLGKEARTKLAQDALTKIRAGGKP